MRELPAAPLIEASGVGPGRDPDRVVAPLIGPAHGVREYRPPGALPAERRTDDHADHPRPAVPEFARLELSMPTAPAGGGRTDGLAGALPAQDQALFSGLPGDPWSLATLDR